MTRYVRLEPSGHAFDVAEGHTVLQAGLEAGLMMAYSCRSGICTTCRGTVEQGHVDYGMVHPNSLSEADKAKGYALLCQAKPLSDLVIRVREVESLPAREVPCRIERLEKPAPDVALIGLRLPMNENFRFLAGQYIDILLEDGKRRSYSIATRPEPGGVTALELHARHSPGGLFTSRIFEDRLKVRTLLRFEGPLGSFFLREDSAKPIVMVASGTGFAPIKAMCEQAFQKGLTRPITLYWGCRTRRDLYMLDLASGWRHPGFTFVPVLSDPTAACEWTGRTGFVHRAVMEDFPDMSGVQVYACGAPVMVDSARRDFSARCGLPHDEFYADSFLTEAEKAATAATVA